MYPARSAHSTAAAHRSAEDGDAYSQVCVLQPLRSAGAWHHLVSATSTQDATLQTAGRSRVRTPRSAAVLDAGPLRRRTPSCAPEGSAGYGDDRQPLLVRLFCHMRASPTAPASMTHPRSTTTRTGYRPYSIRRSPIGVASRSISIVVKTQIMAIFIGAKDAAAAGRLRHEMFEQPRSVTWPTVTAPPSYGALTLPRTSDSDNKPFIESTSNWVSGDRQHRTRKFRLGMGAIRWRRQRSCIRRRVHDFAMHRQQRGNLQGSVDYRLPANRRQRLNSTAADDRQTPFQRSRKRRQYQQSRAARCARGGLFDFGPAKQALVKEFETADEQIAQRLLANVWRCVWSPGPLRPGRSRRAWPPANLIDWAGGGLKNCADRAQYLGKRYRTYCRPEQRLYRSPVTIAPIETSSRLAVSQLDAAALRSGTTIVSASRHAASIGNVRVNIADRSCYGRT